MIGPNEKNIEIIPVNQQPLENNNYDVFFSSPEVDELSNSLIKKENRKKRLRTSIGAVILATMGLYGWSVLSGETNNLKITAAVSFSQTEQNIMDNLDSELSKLGEGLSFLALGSIGLMKIISARDKRISVIDQWSSKDMTSDGISRHQKVSGFLEKTAAGKVPLVLAGGVLLGSMSSAIASAVTDGPKSAIQNFTQSMPGKTFVVEYPNNFTMTDGFITGSLATKIEQRSNQEGIKAFSFGFNLGELSFKQNNLSDLSLGLNVNKNSSLYYNVLQNCKNIPVFVDSSAHIPNKSDLSINGFSAIVVGQANRISATNRLGIEMSLTAMDDCLIKNNSHPVTGIVMNTSEKKARQIVNSSNIHHEQISVISKSNYEENSINFWDSNVLPLISVLEIASLALVGVYAKQSSKEQITRLRREWAIKSASGVSDNMIRSTEILRALKNGTVATIVGGSLTMLLTPEIINSLILGINYSVDYKDLMVGSAIGIGGASIGAIINSINIKKLVDVPENTRS